MFDWENTIALHEMQGNLASSHGEREVSWVSRVVAGTGLYSRVTAGKLILNGSLFSEVSTPV